MKISSNAAAPKFTPFDLTRHIESLDEAAKLYAIFNSVPVVETVGLSSMPRRWNVVDKLCYGSGETSDTNF